MLEKMFMNNISIGAIGLVDSCRTLKIIEVANLWDISLIFFMVGFYFSNSDMRRFQ